MLGALVTHEKLSLPRDKRICLSLFIYLFFPQNDNNGNDLVKCICCTLDITADKHSSSIIQTSNKDVFERKNNVKNGALRLGDGHNSPIS